MQDTLEAHAAHLDRELRLAHLKQEQEEADHRRKVGVSSHRISPHLIPSHLILLTLTLYHYHYHYNPLSIAISRTPVHPG